MSAAAATGGLPVRTAARRGPAPRSRALFSGALLPRTLLSRAVLPRHLRTPARPALDRPEEQP